MFITGAVDLLKRHSGIFWDPGRFAGFLRGEDTRRSGNPSSPTISEVSRRASLSITPYGNAWGHPTSFPLFIGIHTLCRKRETFITKLGEGRKR